MRTNAPNQRRRGSATLVVLALVVLIGAFVIANTRLLDNLDRELRQIEVKQQKRLNGPPKTTKPARKPADKSGSPP
jgi:hypothetical protein